MTIRLRTAILIGIAIFTIWFLYAERAIFTPFIAAAMFAYIFNPIVNFFTHKVRLPRTVSVVIIYMLLIVVFGIFLGLLIRGILYESTEFSSTISNFLHSAKEEARALPAWARPVALETIDSFENAPILRSEAIFQFFPKAVSGAVSLFIFLFASFYFLKEGRQIVNRILLFVPNAYKVDVEILLRRINTVLGSYLRGQVFMVVLVSAVLFVALSLLGVRFALIIAIFSGIAEVVPIIGPIVATTVAVIAVLLDGGANYSLTPIQTSVLVIIIYFVVRQLQDYFVIPQVMGRITKLHPLIILFAVIAGGHSAGIIGFLLAVPIAGVLKILLEFFVDSFNNKESFINKKTLGR
jgi:predicted PurR-regulated permease PerM